MNYECRKYIRLVEYKKNTIYTYFYLLLRFDFLFYFESILIQFLFFFLEYIIILYIVVYNLVVSFISLFLFCSDPILITYRMMLLFDKWSIHIQ